MVTPQNVVPAVAGAAIAVSAYSIFRWHHLSDGGDSIRVGLLLQLGMILFMIAAVLEVTLRIYILDRFTPTSIGIVTGFVIGAVIDFALILTKRIESDRPYSFVWLFLIGQTLAAAVIVDMMTELSDTALILVVGIPALLAYLVLSYVLKRVTSHETVS